MNPIEVTVYYKLRFLPATTMTIFEPIHTSEEKAKAAYSAVHTVFLLWGVLKIVLYVCDEIDNGTVQTQMTRLINAELGAKQGFETSRYRER